MITFEEFIKYLESKADPSVNEYYSLQSHNFDINDPVKTYGVADIDTLLFKGNIYEVLLAIHEKFIHNDPVIYYYELISSDDDDVEYDLEEFVAEVIDSFKNDMDIYNIRLVKNVIYTRPN